MTLAFAICWLPIHVLELLKCANSSVLNQLILAYPKLLYSVRAFTHALAYFNSCFNPFLYALLNRNFCLDLADVVPSFRTCCRQAADAATHSNETFQNGRASGVKLEKNTQTNRRLSAAIDDDNDDDEPNGNEMRRKLIEPPKTDANGHAGSIYFDAQKDRIAVIPQ